jgi:hypothetical protein
MIKTFEEFNFFPKKRINDGEILSKQFFREDKHSNTIYLHLKDNVNLRIGTYDSSRIGYFKITMETMFKIFKKDKDMVNINEDVYELLTKELLKYNNYVRKTNNSFFKKLIEHPKTYKLHMPLDYLLFEA